MSVDSRLGQVLRNRYEVIELIGEGGMARVYRGLDRRLSRPVVLKVLKDDLVSNEEFLQRFAREASNAARLSHADILKVYDVDEQDGVPFIVMEYYPAQDLKSILRKVGRLSVTRAIQIADDILDALDYAHSQGIIHRDLKPHNVLITDRNEVKITDFGIAKALSGDSLTRTGTMMGTAHYISPEQAQGQDVGPQTDIYSLGVMLYEMLSGRLPFEGDNPITIALKHVQEAPPPLASRGVDVPPAVEHVVMTALRKDVGERYRDAHAFQHALKNAALTLDAAGKPNGLKRPDSATLDETIVRPAVSRLTVKQASAPSMPAYSLADSGEFQAGEPSPPPRPVERAPSGARAAVTLLLSVMFLAGIAYASYRWILNNDTDIRVQNIVGMTEEEARHVIEGAGLRFTVKELVYSSDAAGQVLKQSPHEGTILHPHNEVFVVVSKGRQTVQVPTLAGLDRLAVTQATEERGLSVRWLEEFNDSVPAGHVISQDPSAGTPVELHSQITVNMSKGPPQVAVPNLLGSVEKEAVDKAVKAGLKVTAVTEKPSATRAKGMVMEQSPKPGSKVNRGTTIEVVVSSGPEARPVPSLKGLTLADARRNAQQQGFSIAVDDGDANAEARVLDQSPLGGATLAQGSAIHVTLEPLPTPEQPKDDLVKIPGVTGMTLEQARATLEEHGLQKGSTDPEASDQPPGTVLRQSPEEGLTVKRGTRVDLVIAIKRQD